MFARLPSAMTLGVIATVFTTGLLAGFLWRGTIRESNGLILPPGPIAAPGLVLPPQGITPAPPTIIEPAAPTRAD
jgi:hypothetical protein